MKTFLKYVSVFCFLICIGSLYCKQFDWHPAQSWNTNFTFNGSSDQTARIAINGNSIFVGGWHDNSSTFGAVGSFNLFTGSNNWLQVGTNALTLSSDQVGILTDRIAYTESGAGGNFFIIRDIASGNIILNEPRVRMDILGYGDSIIALTRESSAKLLIMNNMGVICRQTNLGYNLNQGMGTVRITNGCVFINGLFFQSGYNAFVEKRNLTTGALVWRHEIIKGIRCFMDVDPQGNCYSGANIDSGSGKPFQFIIQKLDANKNLIWQKMWTPNNFSQTENAMSGISVSSKEDIVVIGGTHRVTTSTKYAGYIFGRSMINGDSVFSLSLQNNPNVSVDITDVAFDTSGCFTVIGKERTPRTLFVRKYQQDSLVGITPPKEIPTRFSLSQNYPNPFNPQTKIKFSIPLSRGVTAEGGRGVFVSLIIYDLLGRQIATLVNEELKPGTYEADWDGSNYSSGVYFYKIISDSFVETKKMVLMK